MELSHFKLVNKGEKIGENVKRKANVMERTNKYKMGEKKSTWGKRTNWKTREFIWLKRERKAR